MADSTLALLVDKGDPYDPVSPCASTTLFPRNGHLSGPPPLQGTPNSTHSCLLSADLQASCLPGQCWAFPQQPCSHEMPVDRGLFPARRRTVFAARRARHLRPRDCPTAPCSDTHAGLGPSSPQGILPLATPLDNREPKESRLQRSSNSPRGDLEILSRSERQPHPSRNSSPPQAHFAHAWHAAGRCPTCGSSYPHQVSGILVECLGRAPLQGDQGCSEMHL